MFLFYIINKFYWFKLSLKPKKNEYVLVEYTNNPFMNFAVVLLAKMVSIGLNSKMSIFITSPISKPDNFSRIIYKSFGVSIELFLYDYIKIHGRYVLQEFRNSKSKITTVDDLYNFSYNDVLIGDLLYDMVLRSGTNKATITKIDNDLDDQLYVIIASICYIEDMLKTKNIKSSVFSHPTMFGGVIQRYLFVKYNIHGIIGFVSSSICKMNYLNNGRNPFPAYVQKNIVDQIVNDKRLNYQYLKLADDFILSKIQGKVEQFDSVSAYSLNSVIYKNKLEFNLSRDLDPDKPNVFLSLHVFNDQPNTTFSPFQDYFVWMMESFEVLVKNSNINLIVKEHPSTKFYPTVDFKFEEFKNEMILKYKNLHFINSDDKFNTASIQYIADIIVTSGGSIALEAACWGIPALICSSSYFSGNNLVKISNSKTDYFYWLENIHKLNKPTVDIINRAKLVFYISNGILWQGSWNNNVFFPKMSYEEKSNPNMKKILLYYLKFLLKKESREYVIQMINFVKNENANIFYRDQELAKLEETSLTHSV
jgi:hypothetical protein